MTPAPATPVLDARAAAYRYPSGLSVGPIDLAVAAGERVLITGPTGSGKSTLLRLLAGLLQRQGQGKATGAIRIGGVDPATVRPGLRPMLVGFVGQEPDEAVISGSAFGEVAFALESRGDSAERIRPRAAEVLGWVGLAGMEDAAPAALSGGQRQRLLIAAALAAGARLLLLDEPLAWLDPAGAVEILDLLSRLAAGGAAVVIVEHRLRLMEGWADRVIRLGPDDPPPPLPDPPPPPPPGPPLVSLESVSAGYGPDPALREVSLDLCAGERVAIMGPNGAGKSTLLAVLSGHLAPTAGRRIWHGPDRAVLVPQNPDLTLFCPTVADEIAFGLQERRLPPAAVAAAVASIAIRMQVDPLLDRAPQSLSRGQRLRAAVAAALAADPGLLLLDEPTAGQDLSHALAMFDGLRDLGSARDAEADRDAPMALCFSCHDPDIALSQASRLIVVDRGRIVADGPPFAALQSALNAGVPLSAGDR